MEFGCVVLRACPSTCVCICSGVQSFNILTPSSFTSSYSPSIPSEEYVNGTLSTGSFDNSNSFLLI